MSKEIICLFQDQFSEFPSLKREKKNKSKIQTMQGR